MRRQACGLLLAGRREVAGDRRHGVAVRVTGAIAMADEIKLHKLPEPVPGRGGRRVGPNPGIVQFPRIRAAGLANANQMPLPELQIRRGFHHSPRSLPSITIAVKGFTDRKIQSVF